MAHTRQTPQQKKQVDYDRERRNTYGEAPHGARKSIPRNKRFGHKSNRAAELVELSSLRHRAGALSEETAQWADDSLQGRRDKRWHKVPDTALGFVVAEKLAARGQREGAKIGRWRDPRWHERSRWPGGSPLEVEL